MAEAHRDTPTDPFLANPYQCSLPSHPMWMVGDLFSRLLLPRSMQCRSRHGHLICLPRSDDRRDHERKTTVRTVLHRMLRTL